MVEVVRRRQEKQRKWWRVDSFKELYVKELFERVVCDKAVCVCV